MSVHESAGETRVGLQFSVYPLHQEELHPAIEAAVQAAVHQGMEVTVGRLSTSGLGDEEAVFAALRATFDAARSFGPTVMVATLSSEPPSEQSVAEVQQASRE
jgi:hypothetical protein